MPLHFTHCCTHSLLRWRPGHVHSLKVHTRTHTRVRAHTYAHTCAQPSRNLQLCLAAAWGGVKPGYLRGIADLPQWLPPTLLPVKALTSHPALLPLPRSPHSTWTKGMCTGVGSNMVPNSKNLGTASMHNPRELAVTRWAFCGH